MKLKKKTARTGSKDKKGEKITKIITRKATDRTQKVSINLSWRFQT
jgi:hypothetical protein